MAYDEFNSLSTEEYFEEFPYDSDLRVKYADELEEALDEYFNDRIEKGEVIQRDHFALLFALWFAFVANDQFNGQELSQTLFNNEFRFDSYGRSNAIADILYGSSETSAFNNFITQNEPITDDFVWSALNRSRSIARNETTSLCNKMLHEEASNTFLYHTWNSNLDRKTRMWHRDANSQTVGIDEPFIVGGEEMMYPHDEEASPENVVNCRCYETFSNEDGEFENADDIDYIRNRFDAEYGSITEEAERYGERNISFSSRSILNSEFDLFAEETIKKNARIIGMTESNLKLVKEELPHGFEMPRIVIVDFEKVGIGMGAMAYSENSGVMYINTKYDTNRKLKRFINSEKGWFASSNLTAPYLHEFGHKYYQDTVSRLVVDGGMGYDKAKELVDGVVTDFYNNNNSGGMFHIVLSKYARNEYLKGKHTEVVAEAFTVKDTEKANELLKELSNLR